MPAMLFANGPSTGLGVGIINATIQRIKNMLESSTRIVRTTATTLSLTLASHAGKTIGIDTNSASGCAITLPAATGTGDTYRVRITTLQTQGSVVLKALTTDVFKGLSRLFDSTAAADAAYFATSATSDKATLNRTTTGGLSYDEAEFIDDPATTGVWLVKLDNYGSGTLATPFSET